jgi:hypothetical protein
MLDAARGRLKLPIRITHTTDGVHCAHSTHYKGLAADLGTGHLSEGFERDNYVFQLLEALYTVGGFTCIEVAPEHVHVDTGQAPEFPRPVFLIGKEA